MNVLIVSVYTPPVEEVVVEELSSETVYDFVKEGNAVISVCSKWHLHKLLTCFKARQMLEALAWDCNGLKVGIFDQEAEDGGRIFSDGTKSVSTSFREVWCDSTSSERQQSIYRQTGNVSK